LKGGSFLFYFRNYTLMMVWVSSLARKVLVGTSFVGFVSVNERI